MQRISIFILAAYQAFMLSKTGNAAEPAYQVKPASYWFEHYVANSGQSITAFEAMGSNAVPFLVKILERKPTKLAELGDEAVSKLNDQPRLQKLAEDALPSAYRIEIRRQHAAFLISQIGTNAGAALTALIKIFEDQTEDSRLQQEVHGALLSMGESGAVMVPRYVAYLKSDRVDSRITGAYLLASVGPKARAAVPALMEAVEGTNGRLQWSAACALWRIDRQTNVALRVFGAGLQGTNYLRTSAFSHFHEMGPAAKPVAPKIAAALRDEDEMVRESAVRALKGIDPELLTSWLHELNQQTAANIARLIETIRTGEFPERYRAVEALAVFGPEAREAVPVLIQAVDAPLKLKEQSFAFIGQHNLWRSIADALGEIGPAASNAVPKLLELTQKSKQYAAMSYCPALGKIGPGARVAAPVLESLLRDDDWRLRLAAADALTKIAPLDCTNVVAALRNLQQDPEIAEVRTDGPRGSERKEIWQDSRNSNWVFCQLSTSVALWRLGVEKEPPIEALAELAAKVTSTGGGELWAIKMLGEIGPTAKSALPALRAVLGRNSTLFSRAAAIAIRHIDPDEFDRLGLPGLLAVP